MLSVERRPLDRIDFVKTNFNLEKKFTSDAKRCETVIPYIHRVQLEIGSVALDRIGEIQLQMKIDIRCRCFDIDVQAFVRRLDANVVALNISNGYHHDNGALRLIPRMTR